METQVESKNGQQNAVEVPAPRTERVRSSLLNVEVTLASITPLIMNKPGEGLLEQLRTKEKGSKTAPRAIPREEAEPKVHLGPDGKPALPSEMLYSCLIAAGQHVRLDGRRQISSAKSTMLPAFLTLEDASLPIKPAKWEVDMRRGKNPNGGEMVCIVRPRFDEWSFSVGIVIDTKEIAEETIRRLFEIAGRRIGLGDFRPACKGVFGQFRIEKWARKTQV